MIQFHIYPGGKRRAVTFSYDDGFYKDERLIGLFNRHGVRATFHLNAYRYRNITQERADALRRLYAGHEVACHTFSHGWPARMPPQSVVKEVLDDRIALEHIFGYPILGMSYPSGSYNEQVIAAMEACGIVYARTADSTGDFALPERFMIWHPSCHHKDALPLCERFLRDLDSEWTQPLLYIWGHSHEFKDESDWEHMQKVLDTISGNHKIWYATNMEIYRYMQAQSRLVISADETIFYNPSDIPVWVERDKKEILGIPAGQTMRFIRDNS